MTSPLDNKWKFVDKRKAHDDSYAGAPVTKVVPLRGSDFTGLGIEVCGSLKEGIYIKKVMPQGPAAGIVNRGEFPLNCWLLLVGVFVNVANDFSSFRR